MSEESRSTPVMAYPPGSGVALNFASEYPEMVEKLALVSMSGPRRSLPQQTQVAMPKGKPLFEGGKPVIERLEKCHHSYFADCR